jgi:hypothetical protein
MEPDNNIVKRMNEKIAERVAEQRRESKEEIIKDR